MRLENHVMRYDHRLRPAQPVAPAEGFAIRRSVVRDGVAMAYVHEGVGGYPLLLVHGYPETKRIWWRNIEALAAGGYEVIVPDLRGYGDSDLSPGDEYDLAVYSRDLYALVHDVLGHEHCGVVGGDVGGAVLVDMIHRFPEFVDKLCFFNTVPPMIIDEYRQAGIMPDQIPAISMGQTGDYRYRQGATPDELASELDTPDKRRRYIAEMYGHRLWASPGAFDAESIDFMTEPFAEIERLRAGWAVYQLAYARVASEPSLMSRRVDVPTLVLYGPDDHVVDPMFVHCCEVAFTNRIGPVVVPGAGHFLQWERADILNPLLVHFFADHRGEWFA
jgi:pimeloyl-ACP methyl ester carboxylesterase